MMWVLARAIASLVLTLIMASVVIFVAMQVLPGDPAEVMLGTHVHPDTLAALRAQMGLDQPLMARYGAWVSGFFTGDLGISHTYAVPVSELVQERLMVSLPLALIALILTFLIALPLSISTVARRGGVIEGSVWLVTQIGIAVPNFWFAMVLVLVFAVTWRLLPSGGFPGWGSGFMPALAALLLPAIALAVPQGAILTQVMRSALIDTLHQDFIRTARAKGLTRTATLWRHALRHAFTPVLTVLGLQFSFLLAGTIIIENVFFLPGLGRLIFQAINQRDLVVVQSVAMLLVASVVIVNFLINLTYALIDPRLRRLT